MKSIVITTAGVFIFLTGFILSIRQVQKIELTEEQMSFIREGVTLGENPTTLEITDLSCPACAEAANGEPSYFLHLDNHPRSNTQHAHAYCLYKVDPELYKSLHKNLYLNDPKNFESYRTKDVQACLLDPATKQRLVKENQLALDLKIRKTPTRFRLY